MHPLQQQPSNHFLHFLSRYPLVQAGMPSYGAYTNLNMSFVPVANQYGMVCPNTSLVKRHVHIFLRTLSAKKVIDIESSLARIKEHRVWSEDFALVKSCNKTLSIYWLNHVVHVDNPRELFFRKKKALLLDKLWSMKTFIWTYLFKINKWKTDTIWKNNQSSKTEYR